MAGRLLTLLRALTRRRAIDDELNDELRFHLEMEAEANRARGVSPADAHRWAARDLGGMPQTKEAVRDARASHVMRAIDACVQDARYSIRTLRRSPAFAATAILVLALGVGVNTAVFSIVNAVFFRPLAVQSPNDLMYLFVYRPQNRQTSVTEVRDAEFFQHHGDAFVDLTTHWGRPVAFSADGETETIWGEHVAANYFDVLGVKPMLGRTFLPEEGDLSSTDLSVVISHDLWMRRFKKDPGIIGKQVRLSDPWGAAGNSFTIVGVTGRGFVGLSDPWNPSQYWVVSAQYSGDEYRRYGTGVIGRLRPGVTLAQARAIVSVESEHMQRERWAESPVRRPQDQKPLPYLVLPVSDVRMPFMPEAKVVPLRLLSAVMVVVAMVLLIEATNIAGILMARGVTRTTELAVRQALGAGTSRLLRQLFTESVLLSVAGGLAGLVVAWVSVSLYAAFTPSRFVVDVPVDARVLLFAAVVCVGAGVILGIAPALQARRLDVIAALGGGVGAGATTRTRGRLRHGIVIPQIALSLLLLLVAGVHVRALMHLELANLGYRTDDLVVLNIGYSDPPGVMRPRRPDSAEAEKRAERSRTFYRQVFERVREMPGAEGVALASELPIQSSNNQSEFISRDTFQAGGTDAVHSSQVAVSPGYFRTLGMSVLKGRDFDDRDVRTSPAVAIVSERLATRLWPTSDPIGKSFAALSGIAPNQKLDWLEVVGVVNEIDPVLQDVGEHPLAYVPLGQQWLAWAPRLIARAQGDPSALIPALKRAVTGANPLAETYRVATMTQLVADILYPRRAAASILAVSGLVGLILASIGLYGVISYSVAQRLREIGIRSTLGAGRRDILALVLREGAGVAAIAGVLGLGLGVLALRVTANLVGPVPIGDVITFVVVPIVVAAVSLLACYLPARRAVRMDPMVVLRATASN